jgi:hypothetical protein
MTNIAQGKTQLITLSTLDGHLLREVILQDPNSAYYDDDRTDDTESGLEVPEEETDDGERTNAIKVQHNVIGTVWDNGWAEMSPVSPRRALTIRICICMHRQYICIL